MAVPHPHMLPGVRFVDAPPPRDRTLPRMDVAGLVGFAASGPIGLPVAVEDAQRFRELFGADLTLARDGEAQAAEPSHLGAAVEQFFRNGGRRAWVVRVAAEGAVTRSFAVPGLVTLGGAAARVGARAPGAWASGLSVGAERDAAALPVLGFEIGASEGAFPYRLTIGASDNAPEPGDLIELRFASLSLRAFVFADHLSDAPEGRRLLSREAHWYEVLAPAAMSPDIDGTVAAETLVPVDGALAETMVTVGSPAVMPDTLRVRFALLAWEASHLVARLGNLTFDPDHPRYWGRLPDDSALFGRVLELYGGALGQSLEPLQAEVLTPRFPFAGTASGRCLPIGVAARREPGDALGADPVGLGLDLGDGLDRFTADPFLDPDLAVVGKDVLLTEARHKAEVLRQPLAGLFSLMQIEDVSMIAVPDGGHRRWDRRPRPPALPLPAPHLDIPQPLEGQVWWTLSWSPVGGASGYEVDWAGDPDFTDFTRSPIEPPDPLTLFDPGEVPAPPTHTELHIGEVCDGPRYFRVRALGPGGTGAWSNMRGLSLPLGGFRPCGTPDPARLELALTIAPGADELSRLLTWAPARPPLDTTQTGYDVEVATGSDFADAAPFAETTGSQAMVALDGPSRLFFRVRATAGEIPGPWSNTVLVDPLLLRVPTLVPKDEPSEDLLAIQTALIRLCAARSDTLALLSVPRHFHSAEAAVHMAALSPRQASRQPFAAGDIDVMPLGPAETRALDHAMTVHPWLRSAVDRSDGRMLLVSPPEAAVMGLAAANALDRGAWISPANKAFIDVLGTAPRIGRQLFATYDAIGVNLVLGGPRGIMLAQANTLSARPERLSYSVRRTLHLILRLARAEGDRYVFEPNDARFREAVRNEWENWLGELHLRGALRGATPRDAFAVIVDPNGEALRQPDLGRLVTELRVAPAEPLRFIDVRLIRSGIDGLDLAEA